MRASVWERYIIADVLKLFFLFLGLFYALYALIDYTNHTTDFVRHNYGPSEVAYHYLCVFIQRLEILVPFALMIASMRTLCTMNLNNELVALRAGGIRLKRLARPFLFCIFLCMGMLWINFEFFLPAANTKLAEMKDEKIGPESIFGQKRYVHALDLHESVMLFQTYESAQGRFFDVYWIPNGDEIYRIKYLYPGETESQGLLVDHMRRSNTGQMDLVASYEDLSFESLGLSDDILQNATVELDELALSTLWQRLPQKDHDLSKEEAQRISRFHYMLATPWLCLLMGLGPMPFCIRFTRSLNVFLRYGAAVVSFLAFHFILNATRVLGESQVLSPSWGIWAPFIIVTLPLIWFFIRMR